MNDNSIMPFGKYKGRELQDVPAWYLLNLRDGDNCDTALLDYIEDSLQALEKEEAEKNSAYNIANSFI